MGEIGGNDYNYPFFVGGSIKQLKAMVPVVVGAIAAATSVSNLRIQLINFLQTFHEIKSINKGD